MAGTTTVYDSNVLSTVYDLAFQQTVYDSTVTETVYDTYGCTDGPYIQYDGTPPENCSNEISSVTLYNTNLDILKADGSSVTVQNTQGLLIDEEIPSVLGGISVTTSGNSITTTVYSDVSRTLVEAIKSYTAVAPEKSTASGATYVGLIKTPAGVSGATQFDNLYIE